MGGLLNDHARIRKDHEDSNDDWNDRTMIKKKESNIINLKEKKFKKKTFKRKKFFKKAK